jgi:peptidoglycan-N-acetylglucosamine deacetylase
MSSPLIIAGSAFAAVAAGTMCRAIFAPRSQMFGPVLFRGQRTGPPRLAISFDDGPHPYATPLVLDVLRDHRVAAAFFVVGNHAAAHPDLLRRMHAEGHVVGNHSLAHAYGGCFYRSRYWRREITLTDDLIEQVIGLRPALFRPPMGFKTPHITGSARSTGHATITWSRRGFDGVHTTAQRIIDRLAHRAVSGDIVLLHDGRVQPVRRDLNATLSALPALIETWRSRGLEIVRVDDLLGIKAYQ